MTESWQVCNYATNDDKSATSREEAETAVEFLKVAKSPGVYNIGVYQLK